ncbi:unnamed protein product [Nyctereutes procyonoides]|uniref:(raccoon dog) hypothetical protein n=1 Tax=Nyctereutes procyonoides TaxID=34880 RepID=A0A811Z6S1_NYCPR|nr:unnamed protein product [Nyctereutes procyonoides]
MWDSVPEPRDHDLNFANAQVQTRKKLKAKVKRLLKKKKISLSLQAKWLFLQQITLLSRSWLRSNQNFKFPNIKDTKKLKTKHIESITFPSHYCLQELHSLKQFCILEKNSCCPSCGQMCHISGKLPNVPACPLLPPLLPAPSLPVPPSPIASSLPRNPDCTKAFQVGSLKKDGPINLYHHQKHSIHSLTVSDLQCVILKPNSKVLPTQLKNYAHPRSPTQTLPLSTSRFVEQN